MSSNGTKYAPTLASPNTQAPAGIVVGMAANEDPGEHDIITVNASGYGVVSDGTQVNARVAGVYIEKRSSVSASDGGNPIRLWNGYGARMPQSTGVGDSFSSTDRMLPAYVSARRQIGKLSSASGVGRPLAGLMLHTEGGEAVTWLGDVGQLLARGLVMADAFTFGDYKIADAAASSTLAERAFARVKVPGVVTGIYYSGAAFSASNTDYAVVTIKRYTAYDSYGTGVTVATYDSRAANQGAASAFTPAAFALSGTAAYLRLLPGDVLTITEAKTGSGVQWIGDIDVAGKVI